MATREVPPDALLTHARFLRGLAGALVTDPAGADDVVQETWLAAVKRPPRDGLGLRGWLSRVLRNAVRKAYRSRARASRREAAVARPEATDSVADQIERGEVVRLVLEAVLRLPLPQRSVVMMRFYEEIPPREIAARLEVPVNTVKSRIRLAIATLRMDLDGRGTALRSDWRAMLAATTGLRPVTAGAGTSVAATGGVLMGVKAKLGVAAALAAVLGLGTYVVLGRSADPPPATESAPTPVTLEDRATQERPSLTPRATSTPLRAAEERLEATSVPATQDPASPPPERPAITLAALKEKGYGATTPPDTLEAIVLDGLWSVESGEGLLWRDGRDLGPEGIPAGREPAQTVRLRDGVLRFEGLEPGQWYLGVDLGDAVRRTGGRVRTGEGPNERSFIVLGDAAVFGTVYDEAGRPARDVRVRVGAAAGAVGGTIAETRTAPNGGYEIGRLTSGAVWLSVAYSGDMGDARTTRQRQIVLTPGTHRREDFGSEAGVSRLTGTLRGPDGQPVLGQRRIVLALEGGTEYVDMRVDAEGRYEHLVAVGTYQVHVWHTAAGLYGPTSSTKLGDPLVMGDRDEPLDLTLPGARVVGSVRADGFSAPVTSFHVEVRSLDDPPRVVSEPLGRSGSFRIDGVRPGRYEFRAYAGSGTPSLAGDAVLVHVREADVEVTQDLTVRR